jgi:flavin-dependent dehydrogenase
METCRWDVIILGAGPAGLALATRLASRRVLILERQWEPATGMRIGESLPGAAGVLLQRLGLFEEFQSGDHLERGASIAIWDSKEPVWRDSLRDPSGLGWVINRRQFEQMLLNAAIHRGAQIQYGCRNFQVSRGVARGVECWALDLEGDSTRHVAPVIVDASGRSASLARRLGLSQIRQDAQVCLHSFLVAPAGDEDTTTRILADEDGWWYSVRLANGRRVLAYHLDAKHPERIALQQPEALLKRARNYPLLADVLAQVQPAEIHCRPAGTALLDIANLDKAGPGFLAIGDAAITFDPISSQGLFHSLASAESAATAINAGCWHNPNALQSFKQELLAVASHYLAKLRLTYQGPERFAEAPFWAGRTMPFCRSPEA